MTIKKSLLITPFLPRFLLSLLTISIEYLLSNFVAKILSLRHSLFSCARHLSEGLDVIFKLIKVRVYDLNMVHDFVTRCLIFRDSIFVYLETTIDWCLVHFDIFLLPDRGLGRHIIALKASHHWAARHNRGFGSNDFLSHFV